MAELKRYTKSQNEMVENSTGEWVRFSDVEPLLPKWIKVNERLPEKRGYALACLADGCVGEAVWTGGSWRWVAGPDITGQILAWMPLPTPLEEKE